MNWSILKIREPLIKEENTGKGHIQGKELDIEEEVIQDHLLIKVLCREKVTHLDPDLS